MSDLRRHGDNEPPPLEAVAADDAELWLASADWRAWMEAHPCVCESLCECEDGS